MFWLLLGKSALDKTPFAKTAKWIMIAIPLLLFMLAGLSCVALITSVIPGVGDVVTGAVQQVVAPSAK